MLVFKTKNFNNCLVQANGLNQIELSFKTALTNSYAHLQ